MLEISKTNSKIAINYKQHIEIINCSNGYYCYYYNAIGDYYSLIDVNMRMKIFIKNKVNFGTYWDEKTFNKLMVLI